jgi:F0F1-type ATP synthase membrane subunit b/b'
MRRAGRFALLLCLAAGIAFAEGKEGGDSSLAMWKWANFLVLAGALGYLMAKTLPPLFASRTQAITKDMVESQKIHQDADARAADVDRRLDAIETEIAALRAESKEETTAEAARLAKHTAAEVARIQTQVERELGDAATTARLELRRFAAGLAVDLAEQKIRARMTPATEDRFVRGFVRDLK